MNKQIKVSFGKLLDEGAASYLIGFQKQDIKDIAIQFLKLQYGKLKKLRFYENNKYVAAEFVNQNQIVLTMDGHTLSLTQPDMELIIAFLLDATDEYMDYDHIDIEFPTEKLSLCFMRM